MVHEHTSLRYKGTMISTPNTNLQNTKFSRNMLEVAAGHNIFFYQILSKRQNLSGSITLLSLCNNGNEGLLLQKHGVGTRVTVPRKYSKKNLYLIAKQSLQHCLGNFFFFKFSNQLFYLSSINWHEMVSYHGL